MEQKINYQQLKTIVTFGFKMEYRGKKSQKKRNALIPLIMMFLFTGFTVGFQSITSIDFYSTAFFSSIVYMLLMGNYILIDYPNLVTGPEDFFFYSTRPINSKTYFASKILLIILMNSIFTMAFSLPNIILMILFKTSPFWIYPSFILSNFFSGVFISLFIINFYSILLKFLSYRSIKNISTIFQFIIFIALYSGYFIMTNQLRSSSSTSLLNFNYGYESFFLPPAWFAAFFSNSWSFQTIINALLAVLSILLFGILTFKIISMEYAEKISEEMIKSAEPKKRKSKEIPLLGTTQEARVVYSLLKNHFKFSTQFRMGILAIIPITVIYAVMIFINSPESILDPFTIEGRRLFSNTLLLYIAIGIFPLYIKNALSYSQEAEASWILYTTPYNTSRLITSIRHFILGFFIIPYLLIFTLLFGFYTQAWWSTIKHFLVVSSFSRCLF